VMGDPFPTAFALFVCQVVVIVVLSRILTYILSYFKQPGVVAEMLAGIVLGPTVLGRIPGFSATLFSASSVLTLNTISTFGLW
jgi:Kef-type K+ transport system membrane component KefB